MARGKTAGSPARHFCPRIASRRDGGPDQHAGSDDADGKMPAPLQNDSLFQLRA